MNFPIDLTNWSPKNITQFLITLASRLKESDIFKDMSKEEIFSSLLPSACFLEFICIGGRQILMKNHGFFQIEVLGFASLFMISLLHCICLVNFGSILEQIFSILMQFSPFSPTSCSAPFLELNSLLDWNRSSR